MTEDQEFELMEQRMRHKKDTEIFLEASIAAAQFVQTHQTDLGIMTLRKAFEIGFRAGAKLKEKNT